MSSCCFFDQAEIQTLKAVQESARQERKLMMLQQKEISKMRRSTHYYRDKIRRYREHSRNTPSPDQNQEQERETTSPVPSDGTGVNQSMDEQSSSIPASDIERDSEIAPSEQLEDSLPSTQKDLSTTTRSPNKTQRSNKSISYTVSKEITLSPSSLPTASEPPSVKNLKKLSSKDMERYAILYFKIKGLSIGG